MAKDLTSHLNLHQLPGLPPLLRSLQPVPRLELAPTLEPLRFVSAPALGTPHRLLRPFYKPVAPPISNTQITHESEPDV